jgi:sugar transferase (PEP-CTERM system associated)
MNRFQVTLVAGDLTLALAALYAAFALRFGEWAPSVTGNHPGQMLAFALVVLFSSFFVEMYNSMELSPRTLAMRIVISLGLSFFLLSALYYLLPSTMYGRGVLFLAMIFFGSLQMAWHTFLRRLDIFPGLAKRVLIVGTGPLARQMGLLVGASGQQYVLSGYYDLNSESVDVPRQQIVPNSHGLFAAVQQERAQKVVVSLSQRRGVFPLQEMLNCKVSGVDVVDAPTFYEQVTGKLLLENITPSWFIFSSGFRITNLIRMIKRMMDVAVAGLGVLLVSPLMPVLALLIKLDSPGPIFFRQVRVGQGDKEFTLIKFRSMRQDAESATGAVWAEQDDARVTRLGRLLRKCRLDEIPQLFNVLHGDMSLVGPRPERPEFVAKLAEMIPYYSERHFVKPGVTGWAQVCYPYGASVQDAIEKLRYDLYYVKNLSIFFDIRIMLRTIAVILFREGSR